MPRAVMKIEVDYDARKTNADDVADALTTLLEQATSTVGILDEVGSPVVGSFCVLSDGMGDVPEVLSASGNAVPKDLVIMPNFDDTRPLDVHLIDAAAWYEVRNGGTQVLMVSANEIDYLSETSLEDATGLHLEDCEIVYIPKHLHRWNKADGWYHA